MSSIEQINLYSIISVIISSITFLIFALSKVIALAFIKYKNLILGNFGLVICSHVTINNIFTI